MNKKKRVGYLYGRPVVEGDENEINAHEILAKKEDGYITLAANNNGLKSISHISSAGENFGEVILWMNEEEVDFGYKLIFIRTLKDVFLPTPTLHYTIFHTTKDIHQLSPINYFESTSYLLGQSFDLYSWNTFNEKKILSREELKNYFTNLISEYAPLLYNALSSKSCLSFNNIKLVPLMMLPTYKIRAFFSKGSIKSVYADTPCNETTQIEGASRIDINISLGDYERNLHTIMCSSSNYKGSDIEDTFYIGGNISRDNIDIEVDETFIRADDPYLFISPFVNAIFVLAVKADTNTPVLVNCMDINTKPLREVFGIPENRVIAAPKEGDYIEYPNVDTTEETTKSKSINRGSSALVEALQKMVDSLKSKEDTTNTTETTD